MASCTCANPDAVVNAINEFRKEQTNNFNTFHETFYGKSMTNDPDHEQATPSTGDAATDALREIQTQQDASGRPGLGLAPLRFSNWAAPEISNDGEGAWSYLWQVAGLALAAYNAKKQQDIYDEQKKLSDRYYTMAKKKLDRFMEGTEGHKSYKELELSLLDEVKTEPEHEMDCKDDRKRAKTATNSAYSVLDNYLTRQAKKMHVCIDDSKTGRMAYRKTIMLVDTENYNLIDDQFHTDYKNDRRWNRRSEVLNLGRNMSAEALSFGDVARAYYDKLGPQLDKVTSSIMGAVGYFGGRNDTYYPNMFLGNLGGLNNNLIPTGTTAGQWQPQALSAGV